MRVRKTNDNEPVEDASLRNKVVKTRGVYLFWDKSAGGLMTGRTATGVERA